MSSVEQVKVWCESYIGKKQYEKEEMNKEIKKLFESCNISFLIGSGYCYEKLKTLGDLEKLIEENANNTERNEKTKKAIEALVIYDFFRNCIYKHKCDVENKESFSNSNQFILGLSGLLSKKNDKNLLKRINIFTTNYDMYIEMSLEKNNVYYNDGFEGRMIPTFSTQNFNKVVKQIVQNTERESQIPTINLYKLHGSLSWLKEDNQITYRSNISNLLQAIEKSAEVFSKSEFEYDKTSNQNLSDLIDYIGLLGSSFSSSVLNEIDKFYGKYNELHIINPTKKKFEETLLSNVYYDLLRMYSNELEKNNAVLFVFGFSFKDEHIYSITKRALANPSMMMYIIVYNEEEVESFKEMFGEYNNVFYIYCEHKNIDLSELNSIVFGG